MCPGSHHKNYFFEEGVKKRMEKLFGENGNPDEGCIVGTVGQDASPKNFSPVILARLFWSHFA
jgi:hypothetical protein